MATPGTPVRLSQIDVFCREVLIESTQGNKGKVFVAFSENDATSLRRHVLSFEGDFIVLDSDLYGNLNAEINLKDIWIDAERGGEGVVVSYIEIAGAAGGKFV